MGLGHWRSFRARESAGSEPFGSGRLRPAPQGAPAFPSHDRFGKFCLVKIFRITLASSCHFAAADSMRLNRHISHLGVKIARRYGLAAVTTQKEKRERK
jgi:hypothetical protein